jgi:hypothetical protein
VNEAIRWLLDLDSLDFGQAGVHLELAHPIAPWAWALLILGAAGVAWWSYRRLEGGVLWRALLAGVRSLLLAGLVLVIAAPRLVKPNETEEKDWVLVLADRSASMEVRDAPDGGAGAASGRTSRDAQMFTALEASRSVWTDLERERVLVWLGFDSGAFDLKAPDPGPARPAETALPILGEAKGRRTALGRAVDQALRRAAARPLAGVVIFSDGRSNDEPSRAVLRRLQAAKIPVFSVPLGSPDPVTDVSVRRAEAPPSAFVNDFVPVEVEVDRLGPPLTAGSGGEAETVRVQLVDDATGLVLDEKPASFGRSGDGDGTANEGTARLTLTTRAELPGKSAWTVRVIPGRADLVAENNAAPVPVELVDRPLRVAYFDGYPRWEQRYLKWLLTREKSIEAASLILSSGRRYVQEGEETMIALPRSPEEWQKFDVVMMGDLRPEVFTTEQLEQVKEHVAVRGAGLIWIGGDGSTPQAWRGTPLEDLLPFAIGDGVAGAGPGSEGITTWSGPVLVRPTALAERLGVLRLASEPTGGSWWPLALSDPEAGWSRLYWAQRIDPAALKPAAEVLAEAVAAGPPGPGQAASQQSAPLVVSMRFGAGRVLYVGTDEIWRWRYGRGEFFPERFWLQMIRLLGRESVSRSGKAAALELSPRRAEVEQPIRIAVELIDQSLIDAAPASLKVRIVREGPVSGPPEDEEPALPVELTLLPEGGASAPAPGRAQGPRGVRTFAGTWLGTESGRYRVEVADPLISSLASAAGLSAAVEVWLPEDELRHPETDHPLLERLSAATEGRVLRPDQLGELPALLPNRRLRLAGEPEVETLWDTPLALILLALLLTLEWVGRRLIKLA